MLQIGWGVEAFLTTTWVRAGEAHARSKAKAAAIRVWQVGCLLRG